MSVPAAVPVVVVGLATLLPAGAPTDEIVVGVGEAGSLPLGRALAVEAGAVVGPQLSMAFAADVWAGVRLRPVVAGPVSVLTGGGAQVREGVAPEVLAGLGLDVPGAGAVSPRVDLAWVGSFAGGPPDSTILLSLGAAFRRVEPEPPPAPPVPPPSTPSSASLTLDPNVPGAQVWLPHPVCDWVAVEEVGAHLAGQPPPIPATVHAPGFVPEAVSLGGATSVALTREAPQGALVVIAHPGDRVTVGGAPIVLGADGAAVITVPQGAVSVAVVGGGRSIQTRAAVESGFTTWVRAEAPEPWVVRFTAGSATPTAASRRELAARLPDLGDSTLGVRGSYSPEGAADVNARLADARALATRDLLVSLGVPPDRVEVLPSMPPAEGVEPGDQRVASVIPLGATAAP